MAQLFYLIVDGAVLFDVGIGGGDIGLRLVVVVVADEILHRIFGEEFLEFAAKLGGKGLIVGQHQRGPVDALDDIGHGKGLAAAGYALQGLHPVARLDAFYQCVYGLRLVAGRLKGRYQFKTICTHSSSSIILFHPVLYHESRTNTSSFLIFSYGIFRENPP